MALPASLQSRLEGRLALPLIAAPMFLVSGTQLVVAACRAGVIGSFPTANCRTADELDDWMTTIGTQLAVADGSAARFAPVCPNLIVHKSNPRLADDLAVLLKHRVELVIASVGNPEHIVAPLHAIGCTVFADVASVRHAQKAVACGVDGLVLLTAGAGGQTGWANPFAFVRAVRAFYDGPVVLAGGIADGQALWAARALGCDFGYMGTRFIATRESMAAPEYKQMLVDARLDDIQLTRAFTGLETNMLRPSIVAAGLDPANLPQRGTIDISKDIDRGERERRQAQGGPKRWKEVWSAGHSVSGVDDVPGVAALVARTQAQYEAAREQALR